MRSDQTCQSWAPSNRLQAYPDPLRRVSYFDTRDEQAAAVPRPSNWSMLPALTIAEIYRSRWQVELFFRWIKQALADQEVLRRTARTP